MRKKIILRFVLTVLLLAALIIEGCGVGIKKGIKVMNWKNKSGETGVVKYDELMNSLESFPIVFEYDGVEYSGFKGFLVRSQETTDISNGRETVTVLYNSKINADFRLVTRVYPDENAYEYVIYIENNTQKNTKIFKNIEFRMTFEGVCPYISGLQGDGGVSWYKAYEKDMTDSRNRHLSFTSTSGRPTHHVFPYYNLSYGSEDRTRGTFIAVGWPGTWHTGFETDDTRVVFSAGQNDVNTYIAPGETFRTPLMAFVDYNDTAVDEQANIWRHYFINDVMRKVSGELPETLAGISQMADGMNNRSVLRILNAYKDAGIELDTFWMDAGWYSGASGETVSWPNTGTQEVDLSRFPDGLASIGEYCDENNIKYLLWFEPEDIRLDKDTFLQNNPEFKEEWILGKTMEGTWLEGYLLDLGNAEAREWLIERVSGVIESSGLSIYRQDFNSDPAGAWAANDTSERAGMTENQYVQGYLAYWDALIEKYPYIMIDSCASGGGRNDLETMKRSVPLHYSDLFDGSGDANNTDKTRITQSLFAWFPYFKNESYSVSSYTTRINYAPYTLLKMPNPTSKSADWEGLKTAYSEYELIRNYFYDEYYQLTEYSSKEDRWNGWEFFDKEEGAGFAELICNSGCTTLTENFTLHGLDETKIYNVKDLDGLVDITATGKALMTEGFSVTVPAAEYAVIVLINGQ